MVFKVNLDYITHCCIAFVTDCQLRCGDGSCFIVALSLELSCVLQLLQLLLPASHWAPVQPTPPPPAAHVPHLVSHPDQCDASCNRRRLIGFKLRLKSLCFILNLQQRTSTQVVTPCAPVPHPPGRRALGTSSVVPQGSPRRRTRGRRKWRMVKRLGAVGCQRPAGSMFASISILSDTLRIFLTTGMASWHWYSASNVNY